MGEIQMKRKSMLITVVTLVAILLTATVAFAAVTFDPATGIGFVGKGDVQLAFGWNNSQLQQNASGVSFAYFDTTTEVKECRYKEGEGRDAVWVVSGSRTVSTGVSSDVAVEKRKNSQDSVTGFDLTALEDPEVISDNTGCPDGLQPNGNILSQTSEFGLFVEHGGISHQLAWHASE
jgi:hypothetical protein